MTMASLNSTPLLRFLRQVWRWTPGLMVSTTLLTAANGLLGFGQLYALKLLIDTFTRTIEQPDSPLHSGQAVGLVALLGGFQILRVLLGNASRYVNQKQLLIVQDRLQDSLNRQSARLSLDYYEQAAHKDTLHRAQREAGYRPANVIRAMNSLVNAGINLLLLGGLLVYLNWGIALLLAVSMIPQLLIRLRHSDQVYRWERSETTRERLARYYAWMVTSDLYAKDIRLYRLGEVFADRYRALRDRLRTLRLSLARRQVVFEMLASLFSVLVLLGCFAWLVQQTFAGALTLGALVLFIGAGQRGYGAIQQGVMNVAGLTENNRFLINLYEFFDLKPTLTSIAPAATKPTNPPAGIAFQEVSFAYPGQKQRVLDSINLIIRPGEIVSLVGPNGCGKTTLIKLLCRLYDPTSGSITLNGIDLRTVEPAELHTRFGIVFQDYSQFHLSARDNIGLGDTLRNVDRDTLRAAAKRAGVDTLIESLPNGYDTVLGNWFEGSRPLSMGEWQKIALARALLRDAPILVLDEPTSAIDIHTENEFYDNFERLAHGRTVIIASHRLKTVTMADRIILMREGRIVADGDQRLLDYYGYTERQPAATLSNPGETR